MRGLAAKPIVDVMLEQLRFRELRRASPEAARRYEDAKLAAAKAAPFLLAYSEREAATIRALLAGA